MSATAIKWAVVGAVAIVAAVRDVRTGRVIEGYPVYAIHQDAMGPMALFALEDACGVQHWDEVRHSVDPLVHQFVNALAEGPVKLHYPGPNVAADFGRQAATGRGER